MNSGSAEPVGMGYRPPKPTDYPSSCDWGDCDAPGADWRWSRSHREWLPVCEEHADPASVYGRHLRSVTERRRDDDA